MGDRSPSQTKPAAAPAVSGDSPPADDGVDVTLIRWMLSLTPSERLAVLQRNISSIQKLREAKRGS